MTLSHGNDPQTLDGIGDALRVEAERVQGIADTGTSGLAALVESWAGPDLEVFDTNWRGAQQQLDAAAQLLRVVGERAKEQAQQQREGSGEGGGGEQGAPWLPSTPGADNTLPTPGGPNLADNSLPSAGDPALMAPVKYDIMPSGGGPSYRFPDEDDEYDEDGPTIPYTDGKTQVPQGLSHFEGFDENGEWIDELVYTSYLYDPDNPDDKTRGEIVFADRETGEVTSRVPLEDVDHYGGVTVLGEYTYVSGGGELQVYRTEDLRNPPLDEDGNPKEPLKRDYDVDASSTVTTHNGDLYVTRFDEHAPSKMYRYEVGSSGEPIPTGDEYTVPAQTQGVSFDDDGNAYFSTSYQRLKVSHLTMVSADDLAADGGWTEDNGKTITLPKMAEGSVIIDGQLYQSYESASKKYGLPGSDAVWEFLDVIERREKLTVHELTE